MQGAAGTEAEKSCHGNVCDQISVDTYDGRCRFKIVGPPSLFAFALYQALVTYFVFVTVDLCRALNLAFFRKQK